MIKTFYKMMMRFKIPKNTESCEGCPCWKPIETKKYHRDTGCIAAEECEFDCWTSKDTNCVNEIVRCEFLDYTDLKDETVLSAKLKLCGISNPVMKNKLNELNKKSQKKPE